MRFRIFLFFAALLLPGVAAAGPPCGIPFAFVNGTVIDAGQMNSNFNQVATCIGSAAANNATNINSGTLATQFGGTGMSSWTPGSVVYAASISQLGQDNANFFYNASSHSLGIGTGNPGYNLDVVGNGHFSNSLFFENQQGISIRNTTGSYQPMFFLDGSNNLQIGSTVTVGQIGFNNAGAQRARLDPSGNFFITGFYGVGSSQIGCSNLANGGCTNASNLTSGTLPSGRLSGAYSIGNLTVSNTFGGGGGNVGLDNNEALLLKDAGGTYRIGIELDTANNLHLGDNGGTNVVCFITTASNCTSFVNNTGNFAFTNGFVGYTGSGPSGPGVVLQNVHTIPQTWFSADDVGNVHVFSGQAGQECTYSGGTSWSCGSDVRLKIIAPLVDKDRVMALKPIEYRLTSQPDGPVRYGFAAQDVAEVYPSLVNEYDGQLSLEYTGLIAPLVAKVQELAVRVGQLEAKSPAGAKNARKR